MRVRSLHFDISILVLVLLLAGAGCRRPPSSTAVTCDRFLADSASRLWDARPRTGTTTDSALYAHGRSQLVIRGFARSDSTPIADTLTAGITGGPNLTATFHYGPNGVAAFETAAGFYVVATRCPGCPLTTWPHTLAPGRVDTLDLYLGRAQSQCDAGNDQGQR